jgi:hypothetical protein
VSLGSDLVSLGSDTCWKQVAATRDWGPRRQPDRSGEQPGSAAGLGEEGHAVSVTESAAGG